MDDYVTGTDSVGKAITLAKGIDRILFGASFQMAKWKSNEQAVLQALDADKSDDMDTGSMVFSGDGEFSILGAKWLFDRDQFTYAVKTPSPEGWLTKRGAAFAINSGRSKGNGIWQHRIYAIH